MLLVLLQKRKKMSQKTVQDMEIYLKEVRINPLLTSDEVIELAKKIEKKKDAEKVLEEEE